MTPALIALLASGCFSVWIFTKLQDKTGYGNNHNALIGAAVSFVLLFVVIFSLGLIVLPD